MTKNVWKRAGFSSKKDYEAMFEKIKKSDWFKKKIESYISVDYLGDYAIQSIYDRYTAKRLIQRLPIFDKAYKLLLERGNFSRRKSFGEMHGDNYIWIEKCQDKGRRVIVQEAQSFSVVFIDDKTSFHIRRLKYRYSFGMETKDLKGCTLKKYREIDFKPNSEGLLRFGDARDDGYEASMSTYLIGHEKVDNSNISTLFIIGLMDYWEYYLEDTNRLE